MARPVNANSEATRQRILDSAVELFARHGLDGASIRTIAAASGVSLAMVHHYFGSKDGLHRACVDAMSAELVGVRSQFVETLREASPRDRSRTVGQLVRTALQYARVHQIAVRLLLRQVLEAGELDADRRGSLRLPFLTEASEVLAEAVGRSASDLRLPLQSLVFLIARYSTCSLRELEQSSGKRGNAAVRALEDHLVRVATELLEIRTEHP